MTGSSHEGTSAVEPARRGEAAVEPSPGGGMVVEPPARTAEVTDVAESGRQSRGRGRGRRRARTAAVGAAGIAAVAGGGWLVTNTGGDGAEPAAAALPAATAQVTKQNLVETKTVDGTLGYGDARDLTGGLQGVVTWLPAEGSTVSRGKSVYRLDNSPVILMYGTMPVYRTLRDGVEDGPDVLQLEQNLAALGYDGFTVDDEFTDATADAVIEWQEDLGLPETGNVEVGRVVMAPGQIRVSDQKAQVGGRSSAGQPVIAYTGTTRTVTVDLDVTDQRLAKKGGKVTVELPDGKRVRGTIRSVGTVAELPASDTSGSTGGTSGSTTNSTEDATIEVTVALDDTKGTGSLDQAPVDVDFVSEERKGVLVVPVAALLALREGGYGVEVVDGATTRVVAVEVGMFAGGRVEVSGPGITAGTKVGVPSS